MARATSGEQGMRTMTGKELRQVLQLMQDAGAVGVPKVVSDVVPESVEGLTALIGTPRVRMLDHDYGEHVLAGTALVGRTPAGYGAVADARAALRATASQLPDDGFRDAVVLHVRAADGSVRNVQAPLPVTGALSDGRRAFVEAREYRTVDPAIVGVSTPNGSPVLGRASTRAPRMTLAESLRTYLSV